MRALLITPAPPGGRTGNETTTDRWRRILEGQGASVEVLREWDGRDGDLMIALHAIKSASSIHRFHAVYPDRPLIVALTGTDVYGGLDPSSPAWSSLQLATRLVVLQGLAADELPQPVRHKVSVIHQSVSDDEARPVRGRARTTGEEDAFDVCVLAHMREVKDPLRAARAARLLPARSRVRVVHIGGAMTPEFEAAARREQQENPRFLWLGSVPRGEALARLARCRLMVNSSLREGGANAVGEALVASVPPLASRIPGNVGLLGADYPGYFECGDSEGLAALLDRAESDPAFLAELHDHCRRLRPMFEPAREAEAWRLLVNDSIASMREAARTIAELSALLAGGRVGDAGHRRHPRRPVSQSGEILVWGREPGAREPLLVAPLTVRDVSPAGLSVALGGGPALDVGQIGGMSVRVHGISVPLSGRVAWLRALGGGAGVGVGIDLNAVATDPVGRSRYAEWVRRLLGA